MAILIWREEAMNDLEDGDPNGATTQARRRYKICQIMLARFVSVRLIISDHTRDTHVEFSWLHQAQSRLAAGRCETKFVLATAYF